MSKTLQIMMDPATLRALQSEQMRLYAFKAVVAGSSALPLVWVATDAYSLDTALTWAPLYQAYAAPAPVVMGKPVVPAVSAAAAPGDRVSLTGPGTLSVSPGGTPGFITFQDKAPGQATCGLSQNGGSGFAPLCAFPLYNGLMMMVTPLERVLLMFAAPGHAAGTPALQAYAPGVLVDLAGAAERTVQFNIETLWSWGGAPWGAAVAAGQDLVPLLNEGSGPDAPARPAAARAPLPAGT